MPDCDEFEKIADGWRPVRNRFVDPDTGSDEENVADIVDRAIITVAQMLSTCGGCSCLPQLITLLTNTISPFPLSEIGSSLPTTLIQINEKLAEIVREHTNERINMVAARSTLTLAIEMQYKGQLIPSQIPEKLASQVINDLIRHCCLDAARAQAIGKRFVSASDAYDFYNRVITMSQEGIEKLARKLVQQPDGSLLKDFSNAPKRMKKQKMAVLA